MTMKKVISIAVVLIMMFSTVALTACGGGGSEDLSDSKYVGTWKAVSLGLGEDTDEVSDETILTINGDGTGTLEGGGDVSEFTWEPTSDGFKTKGDTKLTFKDNGDKIVAKVVGVELTFEKQ